MKAEFVDCKTVRIFLTAADMHKFKITYAQMDYADPDTRRAILGIISDIEKQETGHNFRKGKLLVEAFPGSHDGCVLYISSIQNETASSIEREYSTPLLFRFENITMLCGLCKRLFNQYSHLILKSSLFLMNDSYILSIYTYYKLDEKIIAFVKEYARLLGRGVIKESYVKEHGVPLISDNAIETMVEKLC